MKKSILETKELYRTFMRLKVNKPQLEYTVSAGRKGKVGKNGSR